MTAGRVRKGSPQRTDARRNREIILEVADEIYSRGSETVTLEEIARRAGLGRSTVYRHFPDRQALAAEIARQQLNVRRESAANEDAGSFRQVLAAIFAAQLSMRSLVAAMRELPEREQYRFANTLVTALGPHFHRAQQRGEVRSDVVLTDLVLVLEMVEAAVTAPASTGRDAAIERLIKVILDGLFIA